MWEALFVGAAIPHVLGRQKQAEHAADPQPQLTVVDTFRSNIA
jgi:hypothetical protein